ncbi:MAG: PBP1A family penicillin-binding protein [Roseburia sp.]|nr:PBP1A family penicillin-binding protein [Roseburia sp.]
MAKKRKKKRKNRFFWFFAKFQIVLMFLVIGALAYYYYGGYAQQIQKLHSEAVQLVKDSTEATFKSAQTSSVYDANGDLITKLRGSKDVYYVNSEDIPADVKAAIISIEDKKFYRHHGVDYKAIVRAFVAMVKNREVTQGGSTITMQLARNIYLSTEQTWQRKVEEIFIALEMERVYSKDKILEYYLNNIYFGNGYYGIQAASRGYFNKDVQDLDLSQIAYLCGIPNNPTMYNPLTHLDKGVGRRNRILKNMLEDGKISQVRYNEAVSEEIVLDQPEETAKNDYVETYTYSCATKALMSLEGFEFQYDFDTQEEEDAYDEAYSELYDECQKKLYTAGYQIYTSIDLTMQQELQDSVNDTLSDFTETTDDGVYTLQSSAVCIDNDTGFVKAIVGGRSQDFSGYTLNRAYQSFRQPGSTIKPLIVYTPAFENGYTPDSHVVDQPIEDGPKNAGGSYRGEITVRTAVENSINTIAWQLYTELTPKVGLSYLKEMNFSKIVAADETPATALGGFTNGVSAVEMASGYATIENDGVYREPTCVTSILDADGNVVYSAPQTETIVYKQNAARMMTDVLQGVIKEGTARGLSLGDMPCAGKTGTTNGSKDGWFVGYTRYYTTSVWVGYDMPKTLNNLQGATYPGKIWQDFMLKIHEGLDPLDFLPYAQVSDSVNQGESQDETTDESQDAVENTDAQPTTTDTGDAQQTTTDQTQNNQTQQGTTGQTNNSTVTTPTDIQGTTTNDNGNSQNTINGTTGQTDSDSSNGSQTNQNGSQTNQNGTQTGQNGGENTPSDGQN